MNHSSDPPSAMSIALAVQAIPDYSPIAEIAKTACVIADQYPYIERIVAGVCMPMWRAKIVEAQIMCLLGVHP